MSKFYYFNDSDETIKAINVDEIENNIKDNFDKHTMNDSMISSKIIYNIATVSDKPINNRLYKDSAIRETILKQKWLKKYPKPLLKNHDIHSEPNGRVLKASYYSHDGSETLGDEIPKEVIQHYKDLGSFDSGTGSVILAYKVVENVADKIEQGLYLTTSQGSYGDNITCNICGKDIYDEDCPHVPGKEYKIDKSLTTCYAEIGNLQPVENSIVNQPANDSSTFCILPVTMDVSKACKSDEVDTSDKKSFLDKCIVNNDSESAVHPIKKKGDIMTEEMKKVLDSMKALVRTNLLKCLELNDEEAVKQATELFNSFADENIGSLNDLVNLISGSFSTKIEEVKALSDEVSSFKTQIEAKDEEIVALTEAKKLVDEELAEIKRVQDEALKEITQPAEVQEIEVPAETKDSVEPTEIKTVVQDEVVEEKEEETKVEDAKVPNFLETEKKEKKNDFFDIEESLF